MLRFNKLAIAMILALLPICAGAFTVVVDAGHGGRDPGCRGDNAVEKEITLSVSKMLRDLIEKEYGKDVKVVMTRDDDTYISLQQRADIANSNKADLFISVHINSVDKKNPRRKIVEGSQVYVLSDSKTAGKVSAMKKSTDISAGKGRKRDTGSTSEDIGYGMAATGAARLSTEFAEYAMKRLRSTAGRADMGIRQGGFQVLWATAMPAVLVELDYMSNPSQEKFLASAGGQKKCATAIFEAFGDYYTKYAPPKQNVDKKKDNEKKTNNKKSGNKKSKKDKSRKNKKKTN